MARQHPDTAPPRAAYTVAEVAAELRLPYRAALRLVREGQIRSRFTGRQYVVPREAVTEYLAAS
jgi:excisionase family DNA binding protein